MNWYDRELAINLNNQLNHVEIAKDADLAMNLQNQLNHVGITENAVIPSEKQNYRPKTIIDQSLEYIDPTPNIHTLFVQFNDKFFWNVLLPVEVKWSQKMTSCAGTCTFHPRNRECVIALSAPLLKLRPRKDLIETLLHEMIHAYLFVTNNNKDRDGHGPEFQSHMKRINKHAGTNITIYHDFHEEVRLYQQHWWRCNGPCQKRSPYFGIVRRAMNRAPGKSDFWWAEHQLTCGGQFTKIKEPEKPAPKKNNKTPVHTNNGNFARPSDQSSLLSWLKKNGDKNSISNDKNLPTLSNGVASSNDETSRNSEKPRLSFTGTLGGSGSGRSNLLDKFSNSPKTTGKVPPQNKHSTSIPNICKSSPKNDHLKNLKKVNEIVHCPNCKKLVDEEEINRHVDVCLQIGSSEPDVIPSTSGNEQQNDHNFIPINNAGKITKIVQCPNCTKIVGEEKINEHLDECLQIGLSEPDVIPSTSSNKRKSEHDHSLPSKKSRSDAESSKVGCPLCNKKVLPDEFNNHLDICLQSDIKSDEINEVITVDDSVSSSINLRVPPRICLICHKKLNLNETLNSHLEECVSFKYGDSNAAGSIESENSETDDLEILNQYPCPVCMKMIEESLMNEHLDACIVK